jgi:protein-tyrosine phosphatase
LSRSVTIVAAYLMSTYTMRVDEALKLIRSKRPYAEPNMGFMR